MYDLARQILGKDFISAEEIATARGLAYTEDQLTLLRNKLPDQATLVQLRDAGMMLVAGPPTAMTMPDVYAVNPDFFHSQWVGQVDSGFDDELDAKFARTDKVKALTWIAFSKEPLQDSLGKTWWDQQALVVPPMMVPNAAEATWALTTYKAVHDVYLLDSLYVRISSPGSGGWHVFVNAFAAKGLDVNFCWDEECSRILGVSAGRTF